MSTSSLRFRSFLPHLRLDRPARLFLTGVGTLLALVTVFALDPQGSDLIVCDVVIAALLVFNAQAFYSHRTYLFASGFWTALFFLFYFVLKSTEYLDDAGSGWVRTMLVYCALFLVFYNVGYFLVGRKAQAAAADFRILNSHRFVVTCFSVFVASRLLYYVALMLILRGDYNQLELLASTQNQGMSYIFKAFSIGHLAFLMLVIHGAIHRKHGAYILAAIVIYALDILTNASRGALVVLILTAVFLYGRYVKAVSWIWLVALAPPLVFIVSFLGYVRNIDLGSVGAYRDALAYFLEEGDIVWTLFMGRLDLLPAVSAALEAHAQGNLPSLWGASYVDMFLHFVPRNLWPSKPPLTAAYMTAVVAPGPFEDGVLIYPTIVLEGFLNFGVPGVAVAGVMVGGLAARYDRWMLDRRLRPTFFFLTFFTFPLGLIGEGFHSNFVATALYTAALVWLLLGLLRRTGSLRISSAPAHRSGGRALAVAQRG